jgi:hypothetical protein
MHNLAHHSFFVKFVKALSSLYYFFRRSAGLWPLLGTARVNAAIQSHLNRVIFSPNVAFIKYSKINELHEGFDTSKILRYIYSE